MSIILDADAVREEAHDRHEHDFAGGMTEDDHEYIESLDDVTIHDAILDAADDYFWTAFDRVRSDAINTLLSTREHKEN